MSPWVGAALGSAIALAFIILVVLAQMGIEAHTTQEWRTRAKGIAALILMAIFGALLGFAASGGCK